VGDSPVVDLDKVVLVDQFGERSAVIMTDGVGLGSTAGEKLRQVRN
jgi:hypothetical protein